MFLVVIVSSCVVVLVVVVVGGVFALLGGLEVCLRVCAFVVVGG